jgi:hypothetical protein
MSSTKLVKALTNRLDKPTIDIFNLFEASKMPTELEQVLQYIKESETKLEAKIDTFNEKFDNYQKATQWVVTLAFSLIASATVITIISSVFRR